MEPTPTSANMLAAILARIEDAVLRQDVFATSKPGVHPPSLSTGRSGAIAELQRLQSDVGISWDGNVAERASHLDPDAYSLEVMRAERSRLALNRKLEEVLNCIAEEYYRGGAKQDPVFVLPVDDFDLNPPTCLEMLRFLRMLSVPRLFALVVGDLKVARTVLNLKLAGDLAAVAGTSRDPRFLPVDASDVAVLAGQVASHALRKLVPPAQRFYLEGLDLIGALNHRPMGMEGDQRLHDILAAVSLKASHESKVQLEDSAEAITGHKVGSLRDFLLAKGLVIDKQERESRLAKRERPFSNRELERGDIDHCCYIGRSFLETTPRRATDFWLRLNRDYYSLADSTAGEPPLSAFDEPFLQKIASNCRRVLQEDSAMTPRGRTATSVALQPTATGTWPLELLPLQVRPHINQAAEFTFPSPGNQDPPRSVMRFHRAGGWRFDVIRSSDYDPSFAESRGGAFSSSVAPTRDEEAYGAKGPRDDEAYGARAPRAVEDGASPPRRMLTREASASLMLVHDLLALRSGDETWHAPLIDSTTWVQSWATTEWRKGPLRRARLNWPAPPCFTFWGFDQFTYAWNHALKVFRERTGKTRQEIEVANEYFGFVWLSAGTAAVSGQAPVTLAGIKPSPLDWSALTRKLEETLHRAEQDPWGQIGEWILRVAALLLPELGPPTGARDVLQSSEALRQFWTEHPGYMQRVRVGYARELIENGMEDKARQLIESSEPILGIADSTFNSTVRNAGEIFRLVNLETAK